MASSRLSSAAGPPRGGGGGGGGASAAAASPAKRLRPSSSGVSSSPAASARAHGWYRQLAAAWSRRTAEGEKPEAVSRDVATNAEALLRADATKVLHPGVLHAHATELLDILDQAREQAMLPPPTQTPRPPTIAPAVVADLPTAVSDDETTTVLAASAAPIATSVIVATPFRLAPHSFHLLLRLLLVTAQRLPAFYSKHWSASTGGPDGGVPVPLPAGTDVTSFQAFFRRVDSLASQLLDQTLQDASTRARQPWDARIACTSLHLQVLTLYDAPSVINSVEAFWTRLESRILTDAWFTVQLPQYEQLAQVLTYLSNLLAAGGDQARLARVALLLLRAWREAPSLPRAPEGAYSPHSASFVIRAPPPGIAQHNALRTFVGGVVASMLVVNKQAASSSEDDARQSTDLPTSADSRKERDERQQRVQRFGVDVLTECRHQFDAATKVVDSASSSSSSSSNGAHRCLLPLFAALGLLQAIEEAQREGASSPVDVNIFLRVQIRARTEVRKMMLFVLTMPEIKEVALQTLQPSSPASPTWPCTNHLCATCPSCLFVLLASAAVAHSTRWLQLQVVPPTDGPSSSSSEPTQTLLTAVGLVARVFVHLVDYTWVLNGSIAVDSAAVPTPATTSSTTDATAPASATPTLPPAASSTSSKLTSATASRLLSGWTSSSFFQLLPRYTRCLGALFLLLRHAPTEHVILTMVWQKTKYIHTICRWTDLHGGGSGNNTTSVGGSSAFSNETLTEKALRKVRQAVLMQPSRPSLDSPTTGGAESAVAFLDVGSSSGASLRLVPVHLNRNTLRRAQNGLFMSVVMLLYSIVRSPRWRRYSRDEVAQRAYSVAMLLDTITQVEFAATEAFKPYKELLEIILALCGGREIEEVGPPVPQAPDDEDDKDSPATRRIIFGRTVLATFMRLFFQPSFDPKDESILRVQRFLGFDTSTQAQHLARASSSSSSNGFAFPHLLASSNLLFAPTLLTHSSLQAPSLNTPWPPLCTVLPLEPSCPPGDTTGLSRLFFVGGLWSSADAALPWTMRWHFILPWAFQQSASTNQALQKQATSLLLNLLQDAYRLATGAIEETALTLAAIHQPPLPPQPSGSDLETFVRSLIPFVLSRVLAGYPAVSTFSVVLESHAIVFATIPPQDLLRLALLRQLRERTSILLRAIIKDETKLKRWRTVVATKGASTIDLDAASSDEEDEPEDSPAHPRLLSLPDGARLPSSFPNGSLVSVRRLLLLYLQLMQSLDAPLYPRALALLSGLFEDLDPNGPLGPVCTPVRSSLAALVHETLGRGFDQTKRDATADWFVRLVTTLAIPVGLKRERVPHRDTQQTLSPAMLRNLEALKAHNAQRPTTTRRR